MPQTKMKVPTEPTPPTPPGAPVAQQPVPSKSPVLAPITQQELDNIRSRLTSQLESVTDRREEVVEQLARASADERPGLVERLKVLDARLVRIENEFEEAGRRPVVRQTTEQPQQFPGEGGLHPGQVTGISIVFTLAVLMPIAIAYARRLWKRGGAQENGPELREIANRLDRLEQAVDTVAVEMERVSEGQRFVSRVLSEGTPGGALGAGERPAEPLRVPNKDATRVPRGEP